MLSHPARSGDVMPAPPRRSASICDALLVPFLVAISIFRWPLEAWPILITFCLTSDWFREALYGDFSVLLYRLIAYLISPYTPQRATLTVP